MAFPYLGYSLSAVMGPKYSDDQRCSNVLTEEKCGSKPKKAGIRKSSSTEPGRGLQCEVSNLTSVSQIIDKDKRHNWVWVQTLFFTLCNL